MNPRGRLGHPSLTSFTDWPSGIKKDGLLARSREDGFCLGLESVVERRHDVLALGKSGLETVVPVATGLKVDAEQKVPLVLGFGNDIVTNRHGLSHDREVDRAALALVDVLILCTDVERALEFAQRAVDADARCQREGFDGGVADVEVGLGVVGIQRGEVAAVTDRKGCAAAVDRAAVRDAE